jgi:hypothetical protein
MIEICIILFWRGSCERGNNDWGVGKGEAVLTENVPALTRTPFCKSKMGEQKIHPILKSKWGEIGDLSVYPSLTCKMG